MKYVLKKTLTLIITLFIVSLLAFLAFQVIPGDPTTKMLGTEATPEAVAELRAELGLDQNVLVRYWNWLSGLSGATWGRATAIICRSGICWPTGFRSPFC